MSKWEKTFDDLLAKESTIVGLDIDAALRSSKPRPRFVSAYVRRASAVGLRPEQLFSQDIERFLRSSYPNSDCLRPHEVEIYSREGTLDQIQTEHVKTCDACAALISAAQIDKAKLEDFLNTVRHRSTPDDDSVSPPDRDRTDPFPGESLLLAATNSVGDGLDVALDAIGRILKTIADLLHKTNARRDDLKIVIHQLECRYPDRAWDMDLLIQAHETGWPGWAVESLPTLYMPLSQDGRTALVWHYLAACVPRSHRCEIVDELCNGLVYEVKMGEVTALLIKRLAPMFEQSRLGNPFPSNQSMRNVAIEALILAIDESKRRDPTGVEAEHLERARIDIMESPAFLPDLDEIVNALELLAEARRPDERAGLPIGAVRVLYHRELPQLRKWAKKKGLRELARAI